MKSLYRRVHDIRVVGQLGGVTTTTGDTPDSSVLLISYAEK